MLISKYIISDSGW